MISSSEMIRKGEIFHIASGNAMLEVSLYPNPGCETVILLHGGPGVPDDMTEVREWLEHHKQVISFDQRGIGQASVNGCSFTMEDYIGDINSIAGYFRLEKFHLFGHSWGGLYAQLYAQQYPQSVLSLFLCSSASGTGKIWTLTEREIFRYNYRRSSLTEWASMGINTLLGFMGSARAYRRLFRQIIINYHKGYGVEPPDDHKLSKISSTAGIKTRSAIKRHPVLKVFGKTPFPVLITYGEFDAYGKSKEYLFERFPYAKKAIIPASGHTPWKHNMREFVKILQLFYPTPTGSPHPDGVVGDLYS